MLAKKIISAVLATALVGCSTVQPMVTPPELPLTAKRAAAVASPEWQEPALETDGQTSIVLITPQTPPEDVRKKQVRLELEAGATVKDVVAVLGNLGISIVLADPDAGDAEFYLPRYQGTLGGLMSTIARAADVWFTWQDGVVVVTGSEKVVLSLPQDELLAERVAAGLDDVGADDAATSWDAGLVVVSLKPSQLARVRTYLERVTRNAAIVTMQVAIVTVDLKHDAEQGIDWSKLQVALGRNAKDAFSMNSSLTTSTTTNTSTTTSGTTNSTTTSPNPVTQFVADGITAVLGDTLAIGIASKYFSLLGFIGWLQTYGTTDTRQNVVLRTVTGNEVELKSLVQVPYVSNISATTTGTSNSSNVVGSTQTEKANDGLTIRLKPAYDAASNTVTLSLNLSLQAVVKFIELSAGNQLGTLSQPITAERVFNNILRVRPGETAVLGGITYDQLVRDNNAPTMLEPGSLAARQAEHQKLTVQRQAMFVVVRPSIKVMGELSEKEAAPMFPMGQATKASSPASSRSKSAPAKKSTTSKSAAAAAPRAPVVASKATPKAADAAPPSAVAAKPATVQPSKPGATADPAESAPKPAQTSKATANAQDAKPVPSAGADGYVELKLSR